MHMMLASDMDNAVNENDRNDSEEKLIHISGIHFPIIF